MKAKKAEEFGVEFEKFPITNLNDQINIKTQIQKFNRDEVVDGIIIQMPLGTKNDPELIKQIDLNKDVDGMRRESGVMPATVRAVLEILKYAFYNTPHPPLNLRGGAGGGNILVIGNKGLVGSRIQEELGCEGMDKDDFDPKKLMTADAIISATGVASLINGQMVKDGVICIDVGYPKGDFDPSTALKAGFFTPVPGGVGPVTVVSLFANLVELL
jgi:methylenetetrahydrofolate dehydrogenase (NADP+)/methenyltetrahydrofolate cyclohydrolase